MKVLKENIYVRGLVGTLTQLGRERRRERYKTIDLIYRTRKLNFVVFREREQQSMNQYNLRAASKLKFLIFHVPTASRKIEYRQMSYTNKKRES